MKKDVWYNVQKDVVTVQEEYSTVPCNIEGERCIKSIGGVMCGVMYGVILESYWNCTGTVKWWSHTGIVLEQYSGGMVLESYWNRDQMVT